MPRRLQPGGLPEKPSCAAGPGPKERAGDGGRQSPLEAQATEPEADREMGDVELRKEDEDVKPTKDKGKDAAGELIEDAAELGEDEDDMAEVMDNVEEEGGR